MYFAVVRIPGTHDVRDQIAAEYASHKGSGVLTAVGEHRKSATAGFIDLRVVRERSHNC